MASRISTILSPAFAIALGLTLAGGCAAQTPPSSATVQAASSRPSLARSSSLTVYPVSLAGRSSAQVGEVVGMTLERGGMDHLELTSTHVAQAPDRDLAAAAAAFAASVKAAPPSTDYALYCEFLGTPGRSVDEVRTILVAKTGDIVWSDSQTSKDADFRSVSPSEPMQCCVLVSKRLTPVFELADPSRADAREGKLAERWKRETAVPTETEESALAERAKALRAALPKATISVFTPHAPKLANASGAELVRRIAEAGVEHVSAVSGEPKVSVRSGMNQQMVLWSFARSFGEWVKANPPATDYVLHTDYLMARTANDEVGVIGVHLVLCDKRGELVLVDFQNSHQADFQAVQPKTREDCDRLVARRLVALLR